MKPIGFDKKILLYREKYSLLYETINYVINIDKLLKYMDDSKYFGIVRTKDDIPPGDIQMTIHYIIYGQV